MNRFYVYVLFRPWDGSPFYVGKGKGNRWADHERKGSRHYNPYIKNILQKAAQLRLEIPKVKIRQNLAEEEAFLIEKSLIAAIGRAQYGGPLANCTDGGEGVSGMIHSKETILKIGLASLGNKYAIGNKNSLGFRPGPETRKKMSASAAGHKRWLGKNHRTQTREKLSAIVSEKWADSEYKRMMTAIRKQQANSPEAISRQREIAQSLWADPSFREKMSARPRQTHSDATREKNEHQS